MGMTSPARILFAGSPEFSVPGLERLCDTDHEIIAVLTQPDRPAGRGRRVAAGPVKICADRLGLEVMQPKSLSDPQLQDQLQAMRPDLMVVIAYGLLLPAAVLTIPRVACVNVHASLLPRWRGASPIQAAILSGDAQTGISLMKMDEGLDTGPVYARATTKIAALENAGSLHDRLADLGATLLIRHLGPILDGSLAAQPQSESGATYAGRIHKREALICWDEPAERIQRKIRAYNPWPVAETILDGKRLRCWSAGPLTQRSRAGMPGEVIAATDAGMCVQTGDGPLTLTEVQLPGRQKRSGGEFANGYPVIGKILGA